VISYEPGCVPVGMGISWRDYSETVQEREALRDAHETQLQAARMPALEFGMILGVHLSRLIYRRRSRCKETPWGK
jgi:hypothetical protein